MKTSGRLFSLAPAVLIALAIFILSHQQKLPELLSGIKWGDKILHIIAYFCYGVALIFAIAGNFNTITKKKLLISILIIGSLYGISDEFHQSFIPGRTADVFDWLADCIGIILSFLLLIPIKKIISKFKILKD